MARPISSGPASFRRAARSWILASRDEVDATCREASTSRSKRMSSRLERCDDRRVIARADFAVGRAGAGAPREIGRGQDVVEAPADVALAHAPPWRPPSEEAVVSRIERPSEIGQPAVFQERLHQRALLGLLPRDVAALARVD